MAVREKKFPFDASFIPASFAGIKYCKIEHQTVQWKGRASIFTDKTWK